jgi:hypothetical protein
MTSFGVYLINPMVSGILAYLTGSHMPGLGPKPIAVFLGSVAVTLLPKRSLFKTFV